MVRPSQFNVGILKYHHLNDAVGNWPKIIVWDLVSNVDGGSHFLRDVDKKLVIEHIKLIHRFFTLCASVRDQRSEDDDDGSMVLQLLRSKI